MRRRILTSIIAVTMLAVVVFGVPLAVVVRDQYLADATLQLEREATTAARQVPADVATSLDPVELPAPTASTRLGLYDPSGRKLHGEGPMEGDVPVQLAGKNEIQDTENGGRLVVAVPVVANEQVIAVMRAEQPLSVVDHRVWKAWVVMAGLALAAIGVAGLLARRQARRLCQPVEAVRQAAQRLGDGDFTINPVVWGVSELDDVSVALATTAGRLDSLVARERAFSADASHQLRTPLTGLRLIIESELASPRANADVVLDEALIEVDRLERTIDQLLTLARDTPQDRGPLDLGPLFDELERRWHGPLAAAGRRFSSDIDHPLPAVRASRSAVAQVLEVLLDNAQRHGEGSVILAAHAVETGVAIGVGDEGMIAGDAAERLFERRSSDAQGHGIGLALARSLAEAEGGRLLWAPVQHRSVFQLVLPSHTAPSSVGQEPVALQR